MKSRLLLALALSAVATSCLSPRDTPTVRTFLPARAVSLREVESGTRLFLREPEVIAASHLRSPLLWRLSRVEIFYDEANLWAQQPEEIVREALAEMLFGSGPFLMLPARNAPRLEIRVEEFEGLLYEGERARVRITATLLEDSGDVPKRRSFEAERPTGERSSAALARSLGEGLTDVLEEVRDWLISELASDS